MSLLWRDASIPRNAKSKDSFPRPWQGEAVRSASTAVSMAASPEQQRASVARDLARRPELKTRGGQVRLRSCVKLGARLMFILCIGSRH